MRVASYTVKIAVIATGDIAAALRFQEMTKWWRQMGARMHSEE